MLSRLIEVGTGMATMGSLNAARLVCVACGGRVSVTDPLTGLADRVGFHDALEKRVAARLEAALHDETDGFAVLLIDLDRFKAVNDTMGHSAGDVLLASVARRLRRAVRGSDVVARLGGDEFAVLLALPAGVDAATTAAKRIIELVSQPYLLDGRVAAVGASVGITLSPPECSAGSEMLLRQADLAMYQAKAAGRGRCMVFAQEMQDQAEARRQLELDLRAALHLGQFELFYQPQMHLAQDALTGFEALIRWRHPERGMVPPDAFIGLAEELGLITAIGEWVLATACAEAAAWPDGYTVAVNVSAQQFESDTLVGAVRHALEVSGLPSGRLELEVTETALLRNGPSTMAQLGAIKATGVQVALDDFGTGYSSLTQLRAFAFDRVKIDRSFIDDEAVVRAVSALCNSLGMRTTVEGIETQQQMTRLRSEGCTDGQGYLLSRPVPAKDVGGLIRGLADAMHKE